MRSYKFKYLYLLFFSLFSLKVEEDRIHSTTSVDTAYQILSPSFGLWIYPAPGRDRGQRNVSPTVRGINLPSLITFIKFIKFIKFISQDRGYPLTLK